MAQLKDLLVNGSARVIGSLFANLSGNVLNFGVCSTAAATAAKTVTTNGTFELITGSKILVLFSETDTSNAPTLNVNGTGAKSIKINASDGIGKGFLVAQLYYWFVYDGTNWRTAGAGITLIIPTQYGGTGNSSYTANRIIYSNTATKLASGSITTDGAYLGAVSYLTVNEAHLTSYRFLVNGTSYFKDNITIKGHILPLADSTYNIGSTTMHWANGYFDNLYISTDTGFTSQTSGKAGTLIGTGAIELIGSTPYIDFHQNSSTADYTSRIIADANGRIHILSSGTVADLTYNSRTIKPNLYNQGTIYASGEFESASYFLNNRSSAGGGYHVYGNNVEYGRWWINTIGVAGTATTYTNPDNSSQTKTGYTGNVTGLIYLSIGNNKTGGSNGSSYSSPGSLGTANNALGYLRLYSSGTDYSDTTTYGSRLYPTNGIAIPRDRIGIMFRPDYGGYYTHFSYQTSGNEALVMATLNSVTSFIFVNGESYANVASDRWTKLTGASGAGNAPGILIKLNCVSIGELWASGTNADYKLRVNGASLLKGNTAVGTSTSGALGIALTDGAGRGISLYNGPASAMPEYGIAFAKTATFGTFGDVSNDWATYFTMNRADNRGWIFKSNGTAANSNNNVASISGRGVFTTRSIARAGDSMIIAPDGAYFKDAVSKKTGAIKITLPQLWSNTMMRFIVDIYDYSSDNSVSYYIGGYNYSSSSEWVNTFAYSEGIGDKSNLTVRFGNDGSKTCVTIGEINTVWSYPKVSVRNVMIGHSGDTISNWSTGWNISFITTLPTILSEKSNTNKVISGTASRIAYYNTKNSVTSGSIITDGAYLSNISYLSVNTGHLTSYRAYINGTSYFNGNATFNGHVLPSSTNSYNLGSSSNQWGSVYARKLSTSLTGGTRTTAGGDKGSSANLRYFPEIWTFNAGITPANGDIITIETPGPGHDYGVFLSTNNGTNYYPIVLSGTGRLTTHYGTGTFLTLIFDSDLSASSMFALAGQNNTTRVTVSGGCWRVINYYDSGNPGDWNLRQYNIKAAAAIRAGHIIGGTDAGYKEIDSGAAFDVRYAVLWAGSNISSGSAGSGNYIHHYSVNVKNSSNNNVSGWTSYKNLYIKGTLNGTIFTPISGGSPFVLDLTAADDGYSYFYIGRAYGGNAMTFDATGSKIYDYRNSAPLFHSGNVAQDFTGANSGNAANINADTFAGMTKQLWLNTIYPIGSIYTSVNSTSPEVLFGGTWEALGGRFLIGANEDYTGGNTGGSTEHTHDIAHTHTVEHSHTMAHTHTLSHTHTMAHTHSTANHTLTIAETPSHNHNRGNMNITGTWPGLSVWLANVNSGSNGAISWTPNSNGEYFSPTAWNTTVGARRPGDVTLNAANNWSGTTNSVGGGGAHNHGNTGGSSTVNTGGASTTTTSGVSTPNTGESTPTTSAASNETSGSASTLPPYLVVYMWKRTA